MEAVQLTEAHDESEFGGKAVQLGAALRCGLPVPIGYAVPVALVDAVAGNQPDAANRIAEACERLKAPLAVRSSAVGEDSAGASFAGQYATRLGVRSVEEVLDSILRIWESAHAQSALMYRQRLGVGGSPRMAVILQELLEPDCAGVLFTRNPVTGSDERVIEASWGLGESVVAAIVDPDRYRVSRTGRVVERIVGRKDRALRAASNGGIDEFEVDPALVSIPCLDERRLTRLHRLALACEACFGSEPQDLEWALRDQSVYLLQRRRVANRSDVPGR